MQICIGTWSLRDHVGRAFPLESFPEVVKERYSVTCVELAQMHFIDWNLGIPIPTAETGFLDSIKDKVDAAGCVVANVPIDVGNISHTNEEKRSFDLGLIKTWMKTAAYLGSRAVRVNTESVITREQKNPSPTDLESAISSYRELADYAEDLGMILLLENHGGLSSDPANILDIVREVNHPVFSLCADFGNFNNEVRYKGLETMAPHSWMVHAKTYDFDAQGRVPEFDFPKCLSIFRDKGFDGFISVEFEGKGDQYDGIARTIELIEKNW